MIDNLPKGWIEENISDVVFFQEGPGVRKTQFTKKGVKILNVGNINDNKINLSTTKIFISEEEAYEKYNHFLVENGDLLIACSGIVVNNFHKKIAFITEKDLPLCLNTSTMRFRTLDNKKLNINFYKYFLMTNIFKNQLQKLITGSAQLNFGPSHIKKMFISIPPIQQQEKIVKVLDLSSDLIEKQKKLLKNYDLFLKSKFIEMFGDPITNPMGWEVEKLENLIEKNKHSLKTGPFGSSLKKEFYVENGYKIYGQEQVIKNDFTYGNYYIDDNKYETLKNYSIKSDDILISLVGTFGKIAIVPKVFEEGIINPRLMKISLNKVLYNPVFFKDLFYTEGFKAQLLNFSHGGTMGILNLTILKELKYIKPPIEIQNKFASIVEKIETIKEKENQKLKQLEDLHNSLMQKAFKGEIL